MKSFLPLVLLSLCLTPGCRPSEEDIRRIVRQEIGTVAHREVFTGPTVIGPYSPAVRIGSFLFVSGQIAMDRKTGVMRQDNIEVETRQVMDNLMQILRSQGYDSTHVVSATVYLKSMKDYVTVNAIYGGYFQENNYPARVAVEVSSLPREANIEIAVIACKHTTSAD